MNQTEGYARIDTVRRFPRSMKEAFREWPESALGIDGPVVIRLHTPWFVRVAQWVRRVFA